MRRAAVTGALVLGAAACATPSSLSEALLKQEDLFGKPQSVVLPPTAGNKLGMVPVDGAEPGARRVTLKPKPCFIVPEPPHTGGLDKLEVTYSSGAELKAEMQQVAASAGGSFKDDDKAHLVLEGLYVQAGLGPPDLTGPCDFERLAGKPMQVLGSQTVATRVTFGFSRDVGAKVQAGAVTPGAGALSAGWAFHGASALEGANIVVGGQLVEVKVSVLEAGPYDLGTSPVANERRELPGQFARAGYITLGGFKSSDGALQYSVTFTNPPAAASTCEAGVMLQKTATEQCYFVMPQGSSAIAVSWGLEGGHVKLFVRAYETRYAK